MPEYLTLVRLLCPVCDHHTLHIHCLDDKWDCLACRAAGRETSTLRPAFDVALNTSLDSGYTSARSVN